MKQTGAEALHQGQSGNASLLTNACFAMSIQITDRAHDRIRTIARNEGVSLDSTYLRVAVVPGGCSGLTYDIGWDTTCRDSDRVLEAEGIQVLLDKRSFLYVQDSELDFTDGLDGDGFHFTNPQASRTCACGESFGM